MTNYEHNEFSQMKATQSNDRFLALDSLRGFCACMVVLYHFQSDAWLKAISFIQNAFLFVDFFFVLSGFVIAASYGKRLANNFSISSFMFLRFGRLYPLHFAVLLAFLAVAAAKHFSDTRYGVSDFIISASLTQAWATYQPGEMNHWNAPSWSISAEFWMYLLFALSCRIFRNKTPIAMSILAGLSILIIYFGSDRYLDVCFSGQGFARCVFGFSLGFLTHGAFSLLSESKRRFGGTGFEIIAVVGCLFLVSLAGASPLSLLCPVVFSLAIWVFAQESGHISVALKSKPMLILGTLSYSIYMTHEFILARIANAISLLENHIWLPVQVSPADPFTINSSVPLGGDMVAIISLALVVSISAVTYKAIEKPGRRLSRLFVSNHDRRTPNDISSPERGFEIPGNQSDQHIDGMQPPLNTQNQYRSALGPDLGPAPTRYIDRHCR